MVDAELAPPDSLERSRCPSRQLAAAIALLQEKWALPIIHVLLQGAGGFNELGRDAGAINSSTLSQRLARLEQAGVIRKTVQSTMPPRTSYELTESGRALKPVLDAIAAWADRYPLEETGDDPCEGEKG